jgi:hypothetical protein
MQNLLVLYFFMIFIYQIQALPQYGFNENGVAFLHSETSDQQNPFAVPNKIYWMETPYYKGLVKAKVPVVFIHD